MRKILLLAPRRGGLPTAGLAAWFRKGLGQTDAGGGACSQWSDQSGNSRHYTQLTGASQPTIQGDGTILFDGTSDYLLTSYHGIAQPITRYLRVKQITWTDTDRFCDGSGGQEAAIYQNSASPQIAAYSSSSGPITSTGLAVGAWGSLGVVFDGANSSLNVNGTITSGTLGTTSPGGFHLGSRASGIWASNIQVAEEIIYGVAHDAATQALVMAYLATL